MLGNNQEKLAKKINRLIEKNQELDGKIRRTKEEIELAREEIEYMNSQLVPEKIVVEKGSEMFSFIRDFCMIAQRIIEDEQFIPYTYETKYSGDYYKIEKNTYEEYVCKNSDLDLKKYMQFCVDLNLVKTENGKSFFSSGRKKVYYVSRAFMDAASRDGNTKEEVTEYNA